MQLEDDGGDGSAGSHWERSIFSNDIMTASLVDGKRLTSLDIFYFNHKNLQILPFILSLIKAYWYNYLWVFILDKFTSICNFEKISFLKSLKEKLIFDYSKYHSENTLFFIEILLI